MKDIQDNWTVQEVLQWTLQHFKSKGLASPRLDAELLLAHALGWTRLQLYMNHDKPLSSKEREPFRELIKNRLEGTPVAYLLGHKEFWSLSFNVAEGVLIPRPDTEILVEASLNWLKKLRQENDTEVIRLAELGTGSAAIPLALCSEMTMLNWFCVDSSPPALKIAQSNLDKHRSLLTEKKNQIQLFAGDRLEPLRSLEKFHVIVSNPPYIDAKGMSELAVEVSDFEPHLALFGGPDGLDFYRYLLQVGVDLLKPAGRLFIEIGFGQLEAITALISSPWTLIQTYADLAGIPRCLEIVYLQ